MNKKKSLGFDMKNKSTKEEKKLKIQNYLKNLTTEQKVKYWIKTLISSYNTIPEITKTIDKIVEIQATSLSFMSNIYNGEKNSTSQFERVIDLSERKKKLLNIYYLTKELTKSLSHSDFDFIEKKYVYNWNSEDLANEFNISLRTVYRRLDRIIDNIYQQTQKRNFSLALLESQTKGEPWLKERFVKIATDYFKNINYSESNYNISSSMS